MADCSADPYLTVAALVVASLNGLRMKDALQLADKLYVDVNIFSPEYKEKLAALKQLPASVGNRLKRSRLKRHIFEADGIFPKG